jgi:hypothetical protein
VTVARKPRPLVSAKNVLHAISEIRRRGRWPLFQELEAAEPDLTEFLLEEISAIHHDLSKTGVVRRVGRRLQGRVQTLVLVCVLSLRRCHDGDERDTSVAPSSPSPNPPSPQPPP